MNLLKICNRIIEYSFYALFLFVPLTFTNLTSELFEMNKMWLTWGLTIIIAMSWLTKMVLQKKIIFQRTPLDIPIALFLLSQIISTIFSLDSHTSLWGYYSRFNGGLLSIISYILLYYSFLSNSPVISSRLSVFGSKSIGSSVYQSDKLKTGKPDSENRQLKTDNVIDAVKMVKRLLLISLVSGLIVTLWGLPSHFGYDPTCFIFRGSLNVSCWTEDFMPTVRIFSTLGQPDWLAAYLAILIPISIAFLLKNANNNTQRTIHYSLFVILNSLFYAALLYTRARSGFLGIWIALIFFAIMYFWLNGKPKLSFSIDRLKSPISILFFGFLIVTFIIGTPINQLNKFTFDGLKNHFQQTQPPESGGHVPQSPAKQNEGGTESGQIRLFVWEGAINAWKNNPLIGTGVETFAYAYYKYKPAGQNLTSEWNFLYNKAHNEYLNYLATTGLFGLGTYLGMIGWFVYLVIRQLKIHTSNFKKTIQSSNYTLDAKRYTLILALLASYISILVTNFFGFSVVITNIYLFLIPAFVFVLSGVLNNESRIMNHESKELRTSLYQWVFIFFIILASLFMIQSLIRFWQADVAYALGYNLDRAGEYQQAYSKLHEAVNLRGSEPLFKNELSVNNAILAASLITQENQDKDQAISAASSLAQEAINTSNKVISEYSNNVVFWKTRVRLFYTLSQVDFNYLPRALDAITKASLLAPQDANIFYNLGVLYGQNNEIEKGVEALEKTIMLRPDYRDARYALGLFYRTLSIDEDGKTVINDDLNKKAIQEMDYILKHIAPNDSQALESFTDWQQ